MSLQNKQVKFEYILKKKLKVWSKVNVRKTDAYAGIQELSSNIGKIGIQIPLVVVRYKKIYRIISGQRRFIAGGMAGLQDFPCIIVQKVDPLEATIWSFSENVYRQDMTAEDKAEAAFLLIQKLKTIEAVSDRLGVSKSSVSRYLGYHNVPDYLKKYVRENKMNSDTALFISNKFGKTPKTAEEIARFYVQRNKDEKSDFYAAIQDAPSSESLDAIKSRFKKIKSSEPFKIRLPSDSSKIIKKLANQSNRSVSEVIVQIIESALVLFKTGKMRI